MVQIKANEAVDSFLAQLKERAEVIGVEGKLLGYFTPALSPEEELRQKAFAEYDPERARRRRESPEGGFTTEQVKSHLNSLSGS
jgi:hypothetical protein